MKKKILIVDDDKFIQEILSRCLNFPGCVLDTACNGLDALKLLGNNNYDLVITDYEMPFMNGSELIKQIKLDYPACVIIAITANGDHNILLDAGAKICFTKPFDIKEIKKSIKKLL